jgi:hypothetical protein
MPFVTLPTQSHKVLNYIPFPVRVSTHASRLDVVNVKFPISLAAFAVDFIIVYIEGSFILFSMIQVTSSLVIAINCS